MAALDPKSTEIGAGPAAAEDQPTKTEQRPHAVEMAVRFVAGQVGGAVRILVEHHRRDDGYCTGCTTTPTRWPCTVAAIARASLDPSNEPCT